MVDNLVSVNRESLRDVLISGFVHGNDAGDVQLKNLMEKAGIVFSSNQFFILMLDIIDYISDKNKHQILLDKDDHMAFERFVQQYFIDALGE